MAGFSLFVDVTGGPFDKIAQKGRNVTLAMLFRTFCHVVYATLGFIHRPAARLTQGEKKAETFSFAGVPAPLTSLADVTGANGKGKYIPSSCLGS